jgi:hypothetical protein
VRLDGQIERRQKDDFSRILCIPRFAHTVVVDGVVIVGSEGVDVADPVVEVWEADGSRRIIRRPTSARSNVHFFLSSFSLSLSMASIVMFKDESR